MNGGRRRRECEWVRVCLWHLNRSFRTYLWRWRLRAIHYLLCTVYERRSRKKNTHSHHLNCCNTHFYDSRIMCQSPASARVNGVNVCDDGFTEHKKYPEEIMWNLVRDVIKRQRRWKKEICDHLAHLHNNENNVIKSWSNASTQNWIHRLAANLFLLKLNTLSRLRRPCGRARAKVVWVRGQLLNEVVCV